MKLKNAFDVSTLVFERAAEVFGLLSTPVRLRIVSDLCTREMSVSELLVRVGTSQPAMSQHLTLLYRAGLLRRRREGAQVFYRMGADSKALICGAVCSLTGGVASACSSQVSEKSMGAPHESMKRRSHEI